MSKDPVCGMEVDPKNAKFKINKDGKTNYFCSKHCLETFQGKKTKFILQTAIVQITGMSCVSCAATIEKSIKTLKGVSEANINFAAEKANVKYNPNKVGLKEIEDAIESVGYNVVRKSGQILKLKIIGMDNPHCVGIINSALNKIPGVLDKTLEVTEKASITFDSSKTNITKIKQIIVDVGYKPLEEKEIDREKAERANEINDLKKRVILSFLFAVPLLYVSMGHLVGLPILTFIQNNSAIIQLLLTTPLLFLGSQIFIKGTTAIIKAKTANMDTLIAIGTGSAYIYSLVQSILLWSGIISSPKLYYEIAGLLIFFILLGRYFESVAKGKTSEAIKKLIGLQAKTGIVIRNGKEVEVPLDEIIVGDIVLVKPGQKIPVDGILVNGHSSIDESMISGESIPVEKNKGDKIIGSTINKTGSFTFKATKVGSETVLAQIISFVEEAQASKAPIQKLADQISAVFVPVVVSIAILSAIIWLLLGYGLPFALNSFIAVLIIACPCALGLATPTAVMVGTGIGAKNGILIRNAKTLQKAHEIDTIIFDKTGTLTKGKPELTDIILLGNLKEKEILEIAVAIENKSEHPLAEAIVKSAKEKNIKFSEPTNFKSIIGQGITATYKNKSILLGNRTLMKNNKILIKETNIEALENDGKTVMLLAVKKELVALIAVADTPKKESKEVVAHLHELGKTVIMITGDNKRTANAIAKKLGINNVLAEVHPEDKANEVKKLQKKGHKVAMVGDGINDAPALTQADVGIAIGSGTDVAIESGDIVLVKNDLRDVAMAIDLSAFSMKKIKQNLFWAFFYNSIGIPLAAGVFYPFTGWLLNPIIAGAAMAFSSVSVVSNSLLMKRYKIKKR
ncbi:MAG: heavy metal translocating P-type ATPase [Nanoarchaeota archaeon]|nr:heavy metal translocating P-type ATPase [Nanoarchaeota archaeon]